MDVQLNQNTVTSDKISAYYSLVFPTITYYLQTPNVTIGRRCIPPNSPSSSAAAPQIDIDLGSLKSVSRLHANIEYDETEERWVLAVHGRNGAWVDGVWIQPGKRAPLNERSQIQIASRTFHFELPPPPDTPPEEDMPSPATSHVSLPRERSPSVDITSISPDSSIPSCSPPPPPPPPVPDEKPRPGKAEGAGKNAKSQPNPKKRKKSDIEVPIVKPEVMPPKPPYTYAQLCYRAIKAHGGKATLQDIIGWMIESFEWYKYNVGSGWENSVRHNLSSGKTFKKMERSQGERGKGYYWSIDENFEHIVLEQDAKLEQTLSAANREKAKKNKGPLPPPLTSQPLASKTVTNTNGSLTSTFRALPVSTATPSIVKVEQPNQLLTNHTFRPVGPGVTYPPVLANTLTATHPPQTPQQFISMPSVSAHPATGGKAPGASATVRIPIIVGPVPESYVPSPTSEPPAVTSPHLPTPPIVLHENTLILNPTIFGHLTSEQLKGLETLGAQKALEILQGHIVRFLKERIRTESGKTRGRGGAGPRGRGRGKGGPGAGRSQVKAEILEVAMKQPVASSQPTTTPNPLQPVNQTSAGDDEDVVVDIEGDTDDTERASKRRRMDDSVETEVASDSSASSATVVPRQGSPPMSSLA